MSVQSSAFCQRVLYFALKRMTKDTALVRSGFLYWRENLSQEPFNVDKIVMALVEYLGLSVGEKKTLMISMHSANTKLYAELPMVPEFLFKLSVYRGIERSEAPGTDEQIVEAMSPHHIVLHRYLSALVSFLQRLDREGFTEFKSILREEGLLDIPAHLSDVMITWAKAGLGDLNLPEKITEAECYEVSHALYLLLTEAIGPVNADQIINQAINETLNIPEAARYSPRNLI